MLDALQVRERLPAHGLNFAWRGWPRPERQFTGPFCGALAPELAAAAREMHLPDREKLPKTSI